MGDIKLIRRGDFYEAYGMDAETVAKELNLTLTGRTNAAGERVAMTGIPAHCLDRYIKRLEAKSYTVTTTFIIPTEGE